jgi:spermidine synthase
MMFTWFSAALSNISGKHQTDGIYIAEQAGSLLAGTLFYLASVFWLDAFSVLSWLAVINFLTAMLLFSPVKSALKRGLAFVAMFFFIVLCFLPQYKVAREMAHGREIEQTFFSPYGSIDVLKSDETADYFENGRFFSAGESSYEREELFHPALLMHPAPRRLLLLNASPGLSVEALKYDALKVDFVTPDMGRINLEKRILLALSEDPGKVNFIQIDPFIYLRQDSIRPYDVVLIGGGIPSTLSATRFYTSNFFSLIAKNLTSNGVMMTGGMGTMDEWTENSRDILRVLYATVAQVFPEIRVWAGKKVFFIASEQEIIYDWWAHHQQVLRKNDFLREESFSSGVFEEEIKQVEAILETQASPGTRVRPVLFRLALADLSNFRDIKFYWFAAVLGGMLILALVVFRESAKGVFMAGMVLGGMQVVLLLLWQLVMGDLFRATGLLFSLFMGGLAMGAWFGKRWFIVFKPHLFPVLLIFLSVLSIIAVPVLNSMADTWAFPVATSVFIFIFAVIGGGVFVSGLALQSGSAGKTAALIYGADVAGGALGSFMAAIFFIPFTGLINTGYLFGLAVLIGGLLLMKRL